MGEQLEIVCPKCGQAWRKHGYDEQAMAYTCPTPKADTQLSLLKEVPDGTTVRRRRK